MKRTSRGSAHRSLLEGTEWSGDGVETNRARRVGGITSNQWVFPRALILSSSTLVTKPITPLEILMPSDSGSPKMSMCPNTLYACFETEINPYSSRGRGVTNSCSWKENKED